MGPERHSYGTAPGSQRPHRTKWVILLAVVNVGVFLLYLPPFPDLLTDGGYPEWAVYHPENPAIFNMFSYQFAHAGLFHLGGNVAMLLYAGRAAESRCKGYVVVVYLVGGAAGALAHGLWDVHPLVGASGAVSAVLGSFLVFYPGVMNTIRIVGFWLIALNVVPLFLSDTDVSFAAHIGGFVVGVFLGLAYAGVERRRNR